MQQQLQDVPALHACLTGALHLSLRVSAARRSLDLEVSAEVLPLPAMKGSYALRALCFPLPRAHIWLPNTFRAPDVTCCRRLCRHGPL
jgi:hypothetical protein